MTDSLNYAQPLSPQPPKWLTFLTRVGNVYPVLILLAFYGEWLLAWAMLGHPPHPSLDDPKDVVAASWMHVVTSLLLLGSMPAVLTAFAANVVHALFRQSMKQRIILWGTFVVLWVGTVLLLRLDPGGVVYWWFD